MKKSKFFVKGMHCAACEILLQKEINKLPEVIDVKASLVDNSIEITHKSQHLDINRLNKLIIPHGYQLTIHNQQPITNFDLMSLIYSLIFAVAIIFVFKYTGTSGLVATSNISQTSNLSSFLFLGIIAGLSTCAALVGGLLLSLSKQWDNQTHSRQQLLFKHGAFHAGRIIGFGLFGAILGLIGSLLNITQLGNNLLITSFIIVLVSIVMIIYGLQMLGISYAYKFQIKPPKFFSNYFSHKDGIASNVDAFITGSMTFFIPCGFTIIAQSMALISRNVISGLLIMTAFVLGTLIPLSIISSIGIKSFSISKKSPILSYTLGFVIIFFGLYNLNNQARLNSLPNLAILSFQSNNGQQNNSQIQGNSQIIETSAGGFGYSPSSVIARANTPIIWRIKNNGAGCAGIIISRDLLGDQKITLNNNITEIKLPALKKGTYRYSCWMGMYGGEIIVD